MTTIDIAKSLQNVYILKELPMDVIGQIQAKSKMVDFEKGDFIYFPNDTSNYIFFLKKGKVKICNYSESGKEIIKFYLGDGAIFGEQQLFGEEKRHDFAQAMEGGVCLCKIEVSDFIEMVEAYPEIGMKMTEYVGTKLRKAEKRLESMVFMDARARVIELLKDLAHEHGIQIGYETLIRNTLTHKDLAQLTSTSRQTVNTVLNELKEKNLIYFDRKRILIRDLEALV